MRYFNDRRDWFFQRRLGMFVHWGIYALPAWHEQHQMRARANFDEYVNLARSWNPIRLDPDEWLDLMEQAGMQYICLTTKHHDGFCLWDTKQTDYNTMNTPYGKDVLKQLADACHYRNVPLCLYYSCVDWNQPNYPNQGRHHELPGPVPGGAPDHARYMDFVRAQVRELCTNYGEIAAFWWDMNVEQHVDPSMNALIRHLQPSAVINDRGYDDGDFGTPERNFDLAADQAPVLTRLTEACQSVSSESWGYSEGDTLHTDRHLIRDIDKYLAIGANYMLNVGPKADGSIPDEYRAILCRIGSWYDKVKESLVDVENVSHVVKNRDILVTRRGSTAYVHLYREPASDAVKLKPINTAPRKATLLNTGEAIRFVVDVPPSEWMENHPALRLTGLPVNEHSNTVLVVKLEFDEDLWLKPDDTMSTGKADEMNAR